MSLASRATELAVEALAQYHRAKYAYRGMAYAGDWAYHGPNIARRAEGDHLNTIFGRALVRSIPEGKHKKLLTDDLVKACENGHRKAAAALIKAGADLDHVVNRYIKELPCADIAHTLLNAGVNPIESGIVHAADELRAELVSKGIDPDLSLEKPYTNIISLFDFESMEVVRIVNEWPQRNLP